MSREILQSAYNRIANKFPAEWDVALRLESEVGRRTNKQTRAEDMHGRTWALGSGKPEPISECEFMLSVKPTDDSFITYTEYFKSLDELEAKADSILREYASDFEDEFAPAPLGSGRAA